MKHLLFIALLLTIVVVSLCNSTKSNWVVEEASRHINLVATTSRQIVTLRIKNQGDSALQKFAFALENRQAENLAYIIVQQNRNVIKVSDPYEVKGRKNVKFYDISLEKKVATEESVQIHVQMVFSRLIKPYPPTIKMGDQQRVVYGDNTYLSSPYTVASQKTTITMSSNTIESYTNDVKVRKSGKQLTYGPFDDIPSFTNHELKVHYVDNSRFLAVPTLKRIIEISHWGNIAVEEHYVIQHIGTELNGGFSRFEYRQNPNIAAPSSFRTLVARVPKNAADFYFRDRIGNISTSVIGDIKGEFRDLLLNPRFPMFGGWKDTFYYGYNVPASDFLYVNNEGKYLLNITFGTPIPGTHIDQLEVVVNIPEGASNFKINIPFDVDSQEESITKTYLDSIGRTTITFKKKNVVDEHNKFFQIGYDFQETFYLHEPFLVIAFLFFVCIVTMIYVRLDFSITVSKSQLEEENRVREEELVTVYLKLHSKRHDYFLAIEESKGDEGTIEKIKEINEDIETFRGDLTINKDIVSQIENDIKKKLETAASILKAAKGSKTSKNLKKSYEEISSLVEEKMFKLAA